MGGDQERPAFQWGVVESQLFALYMSALRRLAPPPEGASEPGMFAALARRLGWEPRRGESLAIVELRLASPRPTCDFALPRLRANTVEHVDRERRTRVGGLPWAFGEIELDRPRHDALLKLLDDEGHRDTLDHWCRFQARYIECIHHVAARIEREAPIALDAAPRFVVEVDAKPWAPPAEAQPRFAIPPPPSSKLRARWRHVQGELAAPGVASASLEDAAHELQLESEIDRATLMRAVRLVLRAGPRLDDAAIGSVIEVIDRGLDTFLNAILHHEALQRLEATWRSIAYLVDQIDVQANVRLELLSGDKDEVARDLRCATTLERSALYRHVYTSGYRAAEGLPAPVSILVGLWELGPEDEDIHLLEDIATVAMRAHAVVLVEAAASMFGDTGPRWQRSLQSAFESGRSIFEEASHRRWSAFRDTAASRHVGMCAVRFRVRRPYEVISPLHFREHVDGTRIGPPWSSSAFLLLARMADAFAKYRLVMNFVGEADGAIRSLPGRPASGGDAEGPWAEERVYSRLDYQLYEQGFISWYDKRGPHFAAAPSCHRPRVFENTCESKRAETDYRLATLLHYYLFATRIAQYLKVVRLTVCRALSDRVDLELALRSWLSTTCACDRAGRLLERARITLLEHDDEWLRFELELDPRFKYMGASFTLRASGFVERRAGRALSAEPLRIPDTSSSRRG